MTRKDYEVLARAMRRAEPWKPTAGERTVWVAACCCLSDTLMALNPRFNPGKFLDACGMNYDEVMPYRKTEDA